MIDGLPSTRFGAGIGLHRVAGVAAGLGVDLAAFAPRSLVVTGSNGKGSTAAMTSAMLQAAGLRTGLFTSPHLLRIEERFRLADADIAPERLAFLSRTVAESSAAWLAQRPGEAVGAFEHLFLVAALWFAQERPDTIVWEAGIGGRYDCTRLIRATVTALTSVDLEHTALLGKTRAEIACDKLEACAPGGVVAVGPDCSDLAEVIEMHAALIGVRCMLAAPDPAFDASLPLAGAYQRENAAVALMLTRTHLSRAGRTVEDATLAAGLAATRWPGRLETVTHNPPVVIDVGHTPAALAAAKKAFHALHPGRATLVFGMSADKPAAEMAAALAPGFETVIAVQSRWRGLPAASAADAIEAVTGARPALAASVAQGVAAAQALGLPVYVAGGLFVAAEAKAALTGFAIEKMGFL